MPKLVHTLLLPLTLLLVACGDDAGGDAAGTSGTGGGDGSGGSGGAGTLIDGVFLPDVEAATFEGPIDNPFLPFPVGATWTYEADTPDGLERIEVEVLDETRVIQGVTATVVRDTVTVDGAIVEDTHDWYAQDTAGNVWYLGEDTCEYEDGACVSKEGAWEWGVDGALPGIVMPANPTVDGQPYFQEYDPADALDIGEVVGVGETVETPVGTFTGCVRTHDTSALDPDADEFKLYCPEIGNVRVEEPDATVELVASSGL